MKQKLCLHGLEVKHQAQLLNLVKRLLPGATVKYKTKEKYFKDNVYKSKASILTNIEDRKITSLCLRLYKNV